MYIRTVYIKPGLKRTVFQMLYRCWRNNFRYMAKYAFLNAQCWHRNTPCVEQKGTGRYKREDDACWGLFARVRNMAARGSVSSCLSQSLTEYDASLSKEEIRRLLTQMNFVVS